MIGAIEYTTFYNSPYRWGYQGQYAERDSETGLSAFMLRQYDGRIGRWTTRDVARQFHSPYLAMANNPVAFVDEDGGIARMILNALWGGIRDAGLELVKQYAIMKLNPQPDNKLNYVSVGWEATEGAFKGLLKAANPLTMVKGTKEIVNDIIDIHGAFVAGANAVVYHLKNNPQASTNSSVAVFLAHAITEYSFDKLGDYMGGSLAKDLKSELTKNISSTISAQLANISSKLVQNIMNVITRGYYEVQVGNKNNQWWNNYKKTFGHGQ